MKYYMAPLEGLTTYLFRQTHYRYFGEMDKYFTPFISTHQEPLFTKKDMLELAPTQNTGMNVVPQLMGKSSVDFNWAVGALAEMGYKEVNLNLGCPSGTVVAKGKGSGFLGKLDLLETFLDDVFSNTTIDISIKTRLGLKDVAEFEQILQLYNKYPISELTIHPRVRMDYYKVPVHLDEFERALKGSANPVCFNGDIVTRLDLQEIEGKFSSVSGIMLGRGLIANPALLQSEAVARETLQQFVTELYEGYCSVFGDRRNAMLRMKEIWYFMMGLFDDEKNYTKELRKARDYHEYESLVARLFAEAPIRSETIPGWC